MQTTLWTRCLRYERIGAPKEVLSPCTVPIDPSRWDDNSALVRWLASPINPLDLNIIEGRYSLISPDLPAIGGCEAVGTVERVGLDVRHLKVGDKVIRFRMPLSSGADAGNGVWTELAVVPAESLLPLDPRIDLISAATLAINPPTALALLREFVSLEKGDWIIQNAANSGVGRALIQLAKIHGYGTINLVRARPNLDSLKVELHSMGADVVMAEEEFAEKLKLGRDDNILPEPRLALNGTGGRSALLISSALGRCGVIVTYGGMSKRPSEIATGAFIFKDISARGFSLGTWVLDPRNERKVGRMFEELQQWIMSGQLRPAPAELVPLDKFREAIEKAISHGTKQILLISDQSKGNKI